MIAAIVLLAAGGLLFWLIMPVSILPLPQFNVINKREDKPDIPLHIQDKEAKINA